MRAADAGSSGPASAAVSGRNARLALLLSALRSAVSRLAQRIEDLLGTREVEEDVRLRMVLAALLLYGYLTFTSWYGRPGLSTIGSRFFNYVPFWLFEDARWLIFMDGWWTKTYFYVLCMSGLLGLFWLFYKKKCLVPMLILAFLTVNKLLYYLSDLRLMANFHHIHLILSFFFLISRPKLFFFRTALLVCYLLAAFTKFTPSWLYGEYFNSVPGKLPLLPKNDWVVAAAHHAVIGLELLGPFGWFSHRRWVRLASFGAFFLFHAYSGVIVGHKYTSLMLPVLIPAFLNFTQPMQYGYRFAWRQLPVWLLLGLTTLGGLVHFFIPGDVRLTAEGRYFGLYMFDANRQVRFRTEIEKDGRMVVFQIERPWRNGAILDDGLITNEFRTQVYAEFYLDGRQVRNFTSETSFVDGDTILLNPQLFSLAAYRTNGDPYLYYFWAKKLCASYRPDRLKLEMWQQLDGHREQAKLLDIEDFCSLNPSYSAFRHNEWITLPDKDSHPTYQWW